MLISPAYAQTGGAPGAFDFISLLPLVLIFVVFYFLLIRPQQQKMKRHREVIGQIRKGDRVLTAGGLLGTVVRIEENGDVLLVEPCTARGHILEECAAAREPREACEPFTECAWGIELERVEG